MVTAIYFGIAIVASLKKSLGWLALHHIFFELSFVMNIVVVTVYWTCLHEDSLREARRHLGKIINCYLAHILPCFTIMLNFAITNVIIKAEHAKVVPVVAALYGY